MANFISCARKYSSRSTYAMSTVCTISLFEDGTESNYAELFEELQRIQKIFDVNDSESEITKINENAAKNPMKISFDMGKVLKCALKTAELTDGDFNPAMGELIKLWGINTDYARIPSDDEIKNALLHCDWKKIQLFEIESDENADESKKKAMKIFFEDEKLSLDLGGIAKGYATDCLVEILQKKGVKRAIINLGGNVYVFGQKRDKSLWKVGIKNPLNPQENQQIVLQIQQNSVVTSGNYERFFEKGGKRYHHILDYKTGFPAENTLASVTVICPESMICDVLSTAFFVAGEEKISWINLSDLCEFDVDYILIRKDGSEVRTR